MSDKIKTDVKETVKEPRQTEEVTAALETLRQYGMPLILGVVIALAIGIPAYLYANHTKERKVKAMELLTQARGPKELENIVTAYGATPAAPLAMLRLAKAAYDEGGSSGYDKAAKTYTDFLAKFPNHELRAAAEVGKIHCMEARSETESALEAFTKFIAANPEHYLTSQATLGKARCLQTLGKLSEARTVLEDFMVRNPKSRWTQRIEEMLQQIKRGADTAQAPAPAVSVAPATVVPAHAAQPDAAPAAEPPAKTE